MVPGADISEHFATKYNALYNSVSYSHNEMSEVVDDIDKTCHEHRHETVEDDEMCTRTTQISVNNVNNAITKLKLGKSDGNNGLTTDHLKQGSHKLYVAISILFSMMLSHGYVPIAMHHSIIIPIAKNKRKSLNAHCMSAYGSVQWDFPSQSVNAFYTAIRRLLRLPLRTHTELLSGICADISVDGKLHIRFLNFFRKCLSSSNYCIKLCANLALRGSRSDTAQSVNFICCKYNIDKYDITTYANNVCRQRIFRILQDRLSDETNISISIIKYLMYIRENIDHFFFDMTEISDMIHYMCILLALLLLHYKHLTIAITIMYRVPSVRINAQHNIIIIIIITLPELVFCSCWMFSICT